MSLPSPVPPPSSGFLHQVLSLLRPFWAITVFATVVGTLSGLATAWLLATINEGLHAPDGISAGLLLRFAGLCAISVVGSTIAGIGNSVIGQRIIAALRKDISARVLRAPIATIEKRRSHRLLAVLTDDVDTVSAFTFNFSGYVIAFAIVFGGFAYLAVLSVGVFALALAAVGLGVAISRYSTRGWTRDYEQVRDRQDDLQKQYRAITDGAKELRLNKRRRARVHGTLLAKAADDIAALKIHAMRLFWAAEAISGAIFFLVIGLLLALRQDFAIDGAVISGAVLVLLYIKGPVDQVVACLPVLSEAQVAFRRIAALTSDFRDPDLSLDDSGTAALPPLRRIELRQASYAFPAGDGSPGFTLGPIDLSIAAGQALFIIGENGSGKTTLIELLLGLYEPTSGTLLYNGAPLRRQQLDAYRQLFSAVFSDYFLFDDLVVGDGAAAADATDYLEHLELAHKVAIQDGAFTTTDLSTGQRKRLALIHAYLEQRPVMMFDEWAADQDPTFRRIFYTELLPALKQQGKSLIVVSHDDRYFDAADRIIRLHHGKLVEDSDGQRCGGLDA
jgi:putative ATP-binding cassette transporter